MKLRALDLFCGAGGVSVGLARAGFEVTGVDLDPKAEKYWRLGMKEHGGEFLCADALTFPLDGWDFVWASPPCQAHTCLRRLTKKEYPDLIPVTRERLKASGAPLGWVIENVPGAPLEGRLLMLCGTMFGLATPDGRAEIRRHRFFESPLRFVQPERRHGYAVMTVTGEHPRNDAEQRRRRALSVSGHAVEISPTNWGRRDTLIVTRKTPEAGRTSSPRQRRTMSVTGSTPQTNVITNQVRETYSIDDARAAMGIDWMPMRWLSQAIPPAYSEYIGRQVLGWRPAHQVDLFDLEERRC